ncbi:hypothetical protein [Rickettsia endosymbiont of Cardiosporidium cionae]|uniref:hypothetical protein n=1 Tax=Rickettsia endosymbiont of Cardiosporidium cionae TaxID=2777155 RepID=UPI001895C55B|nr:hypothetical protein [Rickettsia endosymbiont of Cardiosporidium cionae]KAF8818218.1 hypothetical protein IHI24_000675 [Rickettsia endosymbiont of Cardiosporidium cionae]
MILFGVFLVIILWAVIRVISDLLLRKRLQDILRSPCNSGVDNVDFNNLSNSEQLDLSWNFLSNIREYVKNYFSPEDKTKFVSICKSLVRHVRYQHMINPKFQSLK